MAQASCMFIFTLVFYEALHVLPVLLYLGRLMKLYLKRTCSGKK